MTPPPTPPLEIVTAPKRTSLHWTAGTVEWADLLLWLESPADRKECGNYVLGTLEPTTVVHTHAAPDGSTVESPPCTNLHRRKAAVVSRSALSLDVDHPEPDFPDRLDAAYPSATWLLHTTWSSTEDEPRYRLLLPLAHPVAPDEYVVAATAVMQALGHEQFDPGSSQPERYMYRPSVGKGQQFKHWTNTGAPLDPAPLLEDFEADLGSKPMPAPSRTKRDPFEIEGAVGSFNRAYDDWALLIETYDLPYTHAGGDRWHLQGAKSVAGMGPVQGTAGLVYSHHANDPAYGRTCSAFDLVRLHRFGTLDEGVNPQTPVNRLPSHEAMLDLAANDPRVVAQAVGVDFDSDLDALLQDGTDNAWRLGLRLTRTQKFVDSVDNWDLVAANDPVFQRLVHNDMAMTVEVTGSDPLPWRSVVPGVYGSSAITGNDRNSMRFYVEREYGIRPSAELMSSLIDDKANANRMHPVRDYLDTLQWDGTPRVETCLPGVHPDDYARMVARKVMTAAVARIYEPGIKWDHTLVLYGTEGLGKSWWIDKMSRGYSTSLGRIGDKDTLLAMHRSWIVVSDEGHSLRKADHEAQKEFLTRTADVFRAPYDRSPHVHPRHNVIWSTTNDRTFLRAQEGNRRFLLVHCQQRVDFDALTPAYIDQVWAEAVALYRAGEPLYLSDEASATAAARRAGFIEEEALPGVVEAYLETLVPTDWWSYSPAGRQQWLRDREAGFVPPGTERMDRVCSVQVWVEALGQPVGGHRRTDLLEITNVLKEMPGWRNTGPGRQRLPGYGSQLVFERDPFDLL